EYGMYKGILGSTLLNLFYTYTLVLGYFFFLIALRLAKVLAFHEVQGFNKWFVSHNMSLTLLSVSFIHLTLPTKMEGCSFVGFLLFLINI
ncbi:DUF2871 family protein, partial [Bacillus thuringiensis]|nr:DUF2871 family protein [Bacillus thuringiensis]